MRRVAAALAIWSSIAAPALAQDRPGLPVIGVLRIDTPSTVGPSVGLFRDALAALGDVDGKNVRIDVRLAEGDPVRFPELAAASGAGQPKGHRSRRPSGRAGGSGRDTHDPNRGQHQ